MQGSKFFILIFILIFYPLCVFAGSDDYYQVDTEATGTGPANDCPAGTYAFYWDGDNDGGETIACTSPAGTPSEFDYTAWSSDIIDAAYGYSGNGIQINSNNTYVEWTTSAVSTDTATMWVRLYIPSAPTGGCNYLEYAADGDNDISATIDDSPVEPIGFYEVGGVTWYNNDATAVSTAVWITVGTAWDYTSNQQSQNTTGSWQNESSTHSFGGQPSPTALRIGEFVTNSYACGVNMLVDEMWIFNDYKHATPF